MAPYRSFGLLHILLVSRFYLTTSAINSDGCLGNIGGWKQHYSRCIWATVRGNQAPVEESCSRQTSTLLSFNTLGEALDVLGILNISASTPVFIGYLNSTDVNGSLRYDWLGGPGAWSPVLKGKPTYNNTGGDGNQTSCLHLLHGEVHELDCVSNMSISVCESDTDHCSCLNRSSDQNNMQNVALSGHNTPATVSDIDKPSTTVVLSSTMTPASASVSQTDTLSTGDVLSSHIISAIVTASPTSNPSTDMMLLSHATHATAPSPLTATSTIADAKSSTGVSIATQTTPTPVSASLADMSTTSSSQKPSSTFPASLHDKPSAVNPAIKPTNQNSTEGLESSTSSTVNKSNDVNLSETIFVPGPNGTTVEKNMSNIFQHVFSHINKSHTDQVITSTVASTSQTQPSISTSEVTPLVGLNGTGNDTSDGHNRTREMANVTRVSTHPECVFPATSQTNRLPVDSPCNATESTEAPTPTGPPVRAVEFKVQISGLNGDQAPPLLIDSYVSEHVLLKNMSRMLRSLREETQVDNCSLTRFAEVVENIADNTHISGEPQDLKRDLFVDIMRVAEDMVANVADPADDLYVSTETIEISSRIVLPVTNTSHVQLTCEDSGNMDVQISSAIYLRAIMERYLENVRISTIVYRNLDDVARASNENIGSNVMAVSVQYITKDTYTTEQVEVSTDNAIIFVMRTFLKKNKKEDKRLCTHWDFKSNQWSSSGCEVVAKNASHTTCKCDHLTNFAILVMYTDVKISLPNQHVLFALTTVGCGLSIACLAMTLITYIYLNMLSNEKVMIHANLSLALMLAQIVFVSSGDAHNNSVACKAVAVLLHFLFMSSFTWMLVEGVALYLCCARGIFNHRDMRMKYFLLGWGLPTLIVVISFAAKFPEYGNGPQYSCWLSIKAGLIWAFLGPMIVIVLLNICVMALVLKVFLTLKTNTQKTEVARFRGSVRAMLTLLPLLGVTWILGLFVPVSVVFHYFFVILNTIQGMCIFFLHCVCNEEIRKKFYQKRRKWSTTRTASDAEMSYPARKKTGSFDAIKAAAAATTASSEQARRSAWT